MKKLLTFFNVKRASLCFTLLFTIPFSLFTFVCAQTGTWTALTNLSRNYNAGVMLLLTDGTVICHNDAGGTYGTGWDKLTPDIHGSYVNGTWTTIASMNNDRFAFSSQVLPSGKVYAAGGEYGAGGAAGGELYDPVANTWTEATGMPSEWNIYDGNSEILYNGNVLEGPQIGSNPSFDCLFYNPITNAYSSAPSALYDHDEASWLKLPDSSVLFVGIASRTSCRYIPQTNAWVYDANLTENLYDNFGEESGPAFMLPNGKAIFFGATKYNQLYTPTGNQNKGTWSDAVDFPEINGVFMGMPDAPGAMMVNGNILLAVSPVGTPAEEFNTPTFFLEYNYFNDNFTQVTSLIPTIGMDSLPGVISQQVIMLNLPDGNILVGVAYSNQYFIYTPGSAAIPQGKPTINSITPTGCANYLITGKLFNGISEGSAFGDDWQMSTNYPLVRLTDGTNVYYAKTINWNRVGAVQTDSLEDSADFTLPDMPGGAYSVVVAVNGFASSPVLLSVIAPLTVTADSVKTTAGCNGLAIVTASGGNMPYSFLWSPGGQTTDTIKGQCPGNYCCTITDHNGCTQTNCMDVISGIPQLTMYNGQLTIYPNPSNGIFTVTFRHSELVSESQTIEVFDVLGEKVYSSFRINHLPFNIDLRSKPNGVYFYRVKGEDGGLIGEGKMLVTH